MPTGSSNEPVNPNGEAGLAPVPDPQLQERIKAALSSGAPQIYVNGVINVMSNGDVMCVLERNGTTAAVLNMSFTMAKSFSVALGQIVARLEQISGREMLTTSDIERLTKESRIPPLALEETQ